MMCKEGPKAPYNHTTPETEVLVTSKTQQIVSILTSLGESAVGKKMATGTFTYNALRTKTLKESIKTQRKIISHSNSTRAMLLV